MKTQVTSFGFEVLLTFLLPGVLATAAVLMIHGVTPAQLAAMLKWAREAEFLAVVLLLSSIAMLGALIASLQAWLESVLLDRLTAWRLGKNTEMFQREWDNYVHRLPRNSYISRVVLFFQFETRLGLAAVILGAVTILCVSAWHGVAFIVIGSFLYWMGTGHHQELAIFREQFFVSGDIIATTGEENV